MGCLGGLGVGRAHPFLEALHRAAQVLAEAPKGRLDGFTLEPGQTLYAVHRADGERLAVMTDRDSAVAAALAHELAPVSVH